MANTITVNEQARVGNQQFQGLYKDIWRVKATVSDQDAVAINDTATFTFTVNGVAVGDHIIGWGLTVDLSDGTDQAIPTFLVTAANTVSMYLHADVGEFAADALNTGVVKLLIGRPAW